MSKDASFIDSLRQNMPHGCQDSLQGHLHFPPNNIPCIIFFLPKLPKLCKAFPRHSVVLTPLWLCTPNHSHYCSTNVFFGGAETVCFRFVYLCIPVQTYCKAWNFRYIHDFEKLAKISYMHVKIELYSIQQDLVPIPRKLYVAKWSKSEIGENFVQRKFNALQ